jgi:hypothetical protein
MPTKKPKTKYTIIGLNEDGSKFRPSDWTERLVCQTPKQIRKYSGNLKISRRDNIKSIVFNDALKVACESTYNRLMSFAKINKLEIREEDI